MPSFRCPICLTTICDADRPMTTTCGHIFCEFCATFHFTNTHEPCCAVCRTPQALEQLISLHPAWESSSVREEPRPGPSEETVSSSPVHVRAIDYEAQQTADTIRRAIADQEDPDEALLACNTFVNSVPERHHPHLNTEGLREISFQLNLMSTKLKDDHAKLVAKLEQETQSARAEEMRLRRKLEKYRSHREADRVRLAAEVDTLRGEKDAQIVAFREQSDRATTEAKRLRLALQSAEEALNAALLDKEAAESKSLRAAKRYHALKASVDETKKAAKRAQKGRAQYDSSDDLVISG